MLFTVLRKAVEQTESDEGTYGRFDDKLPVHTAPSGTQSVSPLDLLFSKEEIQKYISKAIEELKSENKSAAASQGG